MTRKQVIRAENKRTIHMNPPPGWVALETRLDGVSWENKKKNLFVIVSVSLETDGKGWIHVSVSHRKRLPTYVELCECKKYFIGEDAYAIQIFPSKDNHVDIHPRCLHLWSCLDGHPLPEFSRGLGTI